MWQKRIEICRRTTCKSRIPIMLCIDNCILEYTTAPQPWHQGSLQFLLSPTWVIQAGPSGVKGWWYYGDTPLASLLSCTAKAVERKRKSAWALKLTASVSQNFMFWEKVSNRILTATFHQQTLRIQRKRRSMSKSIQCNAQVKLFVSFRRNTISVGSLRKLRKRIHEHKQQKAAPRQVSCTATEGNLFLRWTGKQNLS